MTEKQKQMWSTEARAGAALKRTMQRTWDLDVAPRFYFNEIKKVEYKGNKVFHIIYQDQGILKTEHVATNTMSKAELLLLIHFFDHTTPSAHLTRTTLSQPTPDVLESADPVGEPNPVHHSVTRLSGIEVLEQKMRSRETPITEAVRSTSITAPERKYRTVRVIRKHNVTVEEEYLLPFTEVTLTEFLEMQQSRETDAKTAVQYLLKRQCDKMKPEAVRNNSNGASTFEIRV
jgi:hypothetical protein